MNGKAHGALVNNSIISTIIKLIPYITNPHEKNTANTITIAIPACEKFLTSISNPGFILPRYKSSIFFALHTNSGAITIAPTI